MRASDAHWRELGRLADQLEACVRACLQLDASRPPHSPHVEPMDVITRVATLQIELARELARVHVEILEAYLERSRDEADDDRADRWDRRVRW